MTFLTNKKLLPVVLCCLASAVYSEPTDPKNRMPWFGCGFGGQVSLTKKVVFHITGNRMKKSTKNSRENYLSMQYRTGALDGTIQKYWNPLNANSRIYLGLGGWISGHRLVFINTQSQPYYNKDLLKGFGATVVGGIGCYLSSKIWLDGLILMRCPIPYFFENYVQYPSLGCKINITYVL